MSDRQGQGSPPPSGLKEQKEETGFLDPEREGREWEGLDALETHRLAGAVGPPPPFPALRLTRRTKPTVPLKEYLSRTEGSALMTFLNVRRFCHFN